MAAVLALVLYAESALAPDPTVAVRAGGVGVDKEQAALATIVESEKEKKAAADIVMAERRAAADLAAEKAALAKLPGVERVQALEKQLTAERTKREQLESLLEMAKSQRGS